MSLFQAPSIKRKLIMIIMLTSGIVLLVACAAFAAYDQITFRRSLENDLTTLGQIIAAAGGGALALDDQSTGTEFLAALKAQPHIVTAGFYVNDGTILAKYLREGPAGSSPPAKPEADGRRYENGQLVIFQPVMFRGDRVGTLHIRYAMDEMSARLKTFSAVVAVILLGAIGMVWIISSRLQRVISEPILDLTKTARVVSQQKDYSVRALKRTQDEVGFLIDQFNEMLAQIQKREEALETANKQLAASEHRALAATQAKSQFLASMSHELRTPLTAIIGFSELLLNAARTQGRAEEAEDLFRINDSAQHLLGLINDILDLSKIEARKMELHVETFEVATLVGDVVSTIRPLVIQKANALAVDCPEDLGSMRADLVKVRQCLFNLLGNANKFTKQGQIRLSVSHESAERPKGAINEPASSPTPRFADAPGPGDISGRSTITFRVSDTGIGMTPEQITKLFQAFTQAEGSTTRKYGGSGLGLTITKHFCEMMGGTIRVESEPNKGSTFTIALPVDVTQREAAEPMPTPTVSPEAGSDDNCILVIDDDPNVHRLIDRTLSPEGYRLRFAGNGEEGLRLARELHPRVITLDVLMPDTDGWSVLSALKLDPALADIPVIMLTIVSDKDLGFALGASEYLLKPIDRTQLLAVMKKYVQGGPTSHVLIVEDDTSLRTMIRRMLELEHWTVVEAANGAAALESIKAKIPAVILLDLIMPVMDGFQVLAELRTREDWRKIPVVVITAKDLSEADRQRLRGQTEKILGKGSYVREELVREVRNFVGKFRAG